MNNNQRQFDVLDILNVISFMLGLENLQENRAQSAHNDVQTANQKQAEYLLEEINKRFEEQNRILAEILDRLKAL